MPDTGELQRGEGLIQHAGHAEEARGLREELRVEARLDRRGARPTGRRSRLQMSCAVRTSAYAIAEISIHSAVEEREREERCARASIEGGWSTPMMSMGSGPKGEGEFCGEHAARTMRVASHVDDDDDVLCLVLMLGRCARECVRDERCVGRGPSRVSPTLDNVK